MRHDLQVRTKCLTAVALLPWIGTVAFLIVMSVQSALTAELSFASDPRMDGMRLVEYYNDEDFETIGEEFSVPGNKVLTPEAVRDAFRGLYGASGKVKSIVKEKATVQGNYVFWLDCERQRALFALRYNEGNLAGLRCMILPNPMDTREALRHNTQFQRKCLLFLLAILLFPAIFFWGAARRFRTRGINAKRGVLMVILVSALWLWAILLLILLLRTANLSLIYGPLSETIFLCFLLLIWGGRLFIRLSGASHWASVTLSLFLGAVTVLLLSFLLQQTCKKPVEHKVHKYDYCLPFAREWYVFHGGATAAQNHHHASKGQKYAIDVIRLDYLGKSYRGDRFNITNYYAFGQSILASADGKVLAVEDDVEDNPIGETNPIEGMGNYIILKHSDNEYTFYCHLRCQSVAVSKGETVRRGQKIAECGNSGNTSEPHLHFQLSDGMDIENSNGILVFFQQYKKRFFFVTYCVHDGFPIRGDYARNVAD